MNVYVCVKNPDSKICKIKNIIQIVMSSVDFCPYTFKDSTDGQYLWGCGSISSEAILAFPKDVVDFGFYAVS